MIDCHWDGIERRRNEAPKPGVNGGTSDAAFLSYIVSQLEVINDKLEAMHNDHIRQAAAIAGLESAIPKDEHGTPDYDGHHDDHASRNQLFKTARRMITNAIDKLFTGALVSAVLFIAYSVLESIKQEVKK